MNTPLLQQPIVISFLLLLLVVLIEQLWVIPAKLHPLSLFEQLAKGMASKVQRPNENSASQQKISGTLAIVMLVVPLIVILALFIQLAEYPYFFDALLLWLSLQLTPSLRSLTGCHQALSREQKQLARERVSKLVLRETDRLSPLGIVKAAIESALLRFQYQYVCVLFYFLLTGGVGALAYRLLYQLQQIWNPKRPQFKAFGQPISTLVRLLQWIPCKIGGLVFALANNLHGYWQATSSNKQHNKLLSGMAGALGIQLSGPAYYQGQKVRSPKVGGSRQVVLADLPRTQSGIQMSKWVLLVLIALISASQLAFFGKGL